MSTENWRDDERDESIQDRLERIREGREQAERAAEFLDSAIARLEKLADADGDPDEEGEPWQQH
jgi:hypothetical protein